MKMTILKIPIILVSIIFLQIPALAQPAIQWQKSLGGSGQDFAYFTKQTSDGGYIIAGSTESNNGDVSGNHGGYGDFWIVKLNSSGITEWQRTLGGSNSDMAFSVAQTFDGGFIVAGATSSSDGDVLLQHGNGDYWVVKLSATGVIQWQKTLGGSEAEMANSIQQTADSGYIVAGYTSSNNGDVTGHHGDDDYWIVKLNSSGNIQWQKALGGTGQDVTRQIHQTYDGGYIVSGYTNSYNGDVTGNHGGNDYWIVKLSDSGSIQWQKALGGLQSDVANSISQTPDSGYIIAGSSWSSNGDITLTHGMADYWIVKLSNSGNLQWQNTYGGSLTDVASSVHTTSDGGYIVAGGSESIDGDISGNHGTKDYWLLKLSSTGSLEWQKSIGGYYSDWASCVDVTNDGGYIISGYSESNDGDVSGNHGLNDYWMVKLNGINATEDNTMENSFSIYPNPATNSFSLQTKIKMNHAQIEVFNVMGEKIYEGRFSGFRTTIHKDFIPGNYFVRVIHDGKVFSEKIILGR